MTTATLSLMDDGKEATFAAMDPAPASQVASGGVVIRENSQGRWCEYFHRRHRELVENIAAGLLQIDVHAHSHVAVACGQRVEAVLITAAVGLIGAVAHLVGVRGPNDDLGRSLQSSSVSLVVVDDDSGLAAARSIAAAANWADPRFLIIESKNTKPSSDGRVVDLAQVLEVGRAAALCYRALSAVDASSGEVVFACEGAGEHTQFISIDGALLRTAARRTALSLQFRAGDELVSTVPVSTPFGHAIVAASLYAGACFNFPERDGSLLADIVAVEPSVLIGSGRMWRDIFLHVQSRLDSAPRLNRAAVEWLMSGTMNTAKTVLVGEPLRRLIGLRRIRGAFSTDFVPPNVCEFFRRLGVNIRELYDVPEAGGVVATVVREQGVGRPILMPGTGIDLSICAESRLTVGRLSGTTELSNGCAAVVTRDIVLQLEHGIVLCGSVDRLVRLADGTPVHPEPIETTIVEASPLIRAAVLVGERRVEPGVLVVLEREPLIAWAQRNGIQYTTLSDLRANMQLCRHVRTLIEEATQPRPIRRVAILSRELAYDRREVTDMDRVWVRNLIANVGDLIDGMYT